MGYAGRSGNLETAEQDAASRPAAGSPDAALAARVRALGPWFHNLRLGSPPVQTAPDHPLGDYPASFWRCFAHAIPADLTGQTVLDIGCNAGFYSFEFARRGARRVLGVDHDPRYLAQAAFARGVLDLDVEFRQLDVYHLDQLAAEGPFDWVLFMGVLYHLRHPLYGLEQVARLVGGRLLFQTMERGVGANMDVAQDYPISERGVFLDQRFPALYFVERSYAHDPTNWWIPNPAAAAAMLRSVGLRILQQPCVEVYLCAPAAAPENGAAR